MCICNLHRTEPVIFKNKFKGWDDVIPVDFTRTSESVQRRGIDMKVRMRASAIEFVYKSSHQVAKPTLSFQVVEEQSLATDFEPDKCFVCPITGMLEANMFFYCTA